MIYKLRYKRRRSCKADNILWSDFEEQEVSELYFKKWKNDPNFEAVENKERKSVFPTKKLYNSVKEKEIDIKGDLNG